MTTVTSAVIETFQKGVALTPKEVFYILRNRGIQTTYKSVSKIVSRLYYRGILDRSGGQYIFSPGGRHSVSNRATQGDTLRVQGDTQKVRSTTNFPSKAVSNSKKVKRNGIRSKLIRRFLAILMNNNIEFFDSDKFYDSLKYKYHFPLNRNTYRVIIYRLKRRGFLNFRYNRYYVNLPGIREFFSVSNSPERGATTPGVPKTAVVSELQKHGGTLSPVSIRVSEHAPRVDIQISPWRLKELIERYHLKPINPKDPSRKMRFTGRHLNAIITKNGYVMITPKDELWLQEVREVFGEEAAVLAKIRGAMKHKEYSLGDIIKIYKGNNLKSQVDFSEFSDGDIGFQGDAEKVEIASELFMQNIAGSAFWSAYFADVLVELDRTTKEMKEYFYKIGEETKAQLFLNSQAANAIIRSTEEIKNVMREFVDILKNIHNENLAGGEVEGYA